MYKTTARNSKRSHTNNVYGDLARIKHALAKATYGMTGRAGQMLSDSLDNVREKGEEIQERASDFVAEKPFKSVGVALLAGVCLGYFLHR